MSKFQVPLQFSLPERLKQYLGESDPELDSHAAELLQSIPVDAQSGELDPVTMPQLYALRALRSPGSIAVQRATGVGAWEPVTIEEMLSEIEDTARGLLGLGIQPGDSVGILAETSYRWIVLDAAIMSIGAVTVGIYESDSTEQIRHILTDADVKFVFTKTQQQADLVRSVDTNLSAQVLAFDLGAARTLATASRRIPPTQVTAACQNVRGDDLATLIYTSGTTGTPKGVELTHANLAKTSLGAHDILPEITLNPRTRALIFLPMAHILARLVSHALLVGECTLAFTPDLRNLLSDLSSFQPTAILAVPRVLEKVYNSALQKAGTGFKRKIFNWSAKQSRQRSQSMYKSVDSSQKTLAYSIANSVALKKVKAALGPNLQYVVCGGAPLAPDLAHFFRGMDIQILQGYGLSETTGPIAVQVPTQCPPDGVGRVMLGNQVRINHDDGEVLVKGVSVFRKYHNLPAETKAAFTEDGWYRTGDLGTIDEDGEIHITGRKKELIVTAGGKNVSPEVLEEQLVTHPLISTVIVVGDRRPYVGALVSLDDEMLPIWLKSKGQIPTDAVTAARLPIVQESIQKAVERANTKVSRAESIRRFRIIDQEFTVENGYLTPSMKLKRQKVLTDLAAEVDELYAEGKA